MDVAPSSSAYLIIEELNKCVGQFAELALVDGLRLFHDVPPNLFRARGLRKRALIGPPLITETDEVLVEVERSAGVCVTGACVKGVDEWLKEVVLDRS